MGAPIRLQMGRVYDWGPVLPASGAPAGEPYRVLVDRLWPRGIRRGVAPWHDWWKNLAPSDELRRWFHADPQGRWEEFRRRYRQELDALPESLVAGVLAACRQHPTVLLLTASRQPERSHVPVLCRWLEEQLEAGPQIFQ